MLSSFSDDSATIGEDSSYFLCTCGAEFELIRHYDRHLRQVHGVKTLIITPDGHNQKQSTPSKATEATSQSSGSLKMETKPTTDQMLQSIKSQNCQMRSKQERRRGIETLSKRMLIKKDYEDFEFRQDIVAWEGFKLIKNRQCPHQPYYCGNCDTILLYTEDYVTHCIKDCRTIIHKDSSHVITLKLEEEETSEDSSGIEEYNKQAQQSDSLKQTLYSQVPSNEPFRQILIGGLDHRGLPFYCGQCKINIPFIRYYRHFKIYHWQKIDQDSSHIIVRFFNYSRARPIYLSSHVPWVNSQKIYFCLCNPNQKMEMPDFIQHIKAMHAGVSPRYVFQSSHNTKAPKRQNGIFQRMRKTNHSKKNIMPIQQARQLQCFHNIFDIHYKMQDHRSLPFLCENCPTISFQRPIKYLNHLQEHRSKRQNVSFSHVILRTQNGRESGKINLFISKDVKWHHDQAIYMCLCSRKDKMNMNSLFEHVSTEHFGISPLYYQDNILKRRLITKRDLIVAPDAMRSLRRFSSLCNNLPFSCYSCKLQLNSGLLYRNHMRDIHNNVIHPCSSHIILLFKKNRYKQIPALFINPHKKWTLTSHPGHYCSCQPERKVTMEDLIQHIIKEHHGVSPEYAFKELKVNNQYFTTRQALKIEESDETKEQS